MPFEILYHTIPDSGWRPLWHHLRVEVLIGLGFELHGYFRSK